MVAMALRFIRARWPLRSLEIVCTKGGLVKRCPINITERLRLHILNICLAAVAGRPGDLETCKMLLIREVEKMVHEASDEDKET